MKKAYIILLLTTLFISLSSCKVIGDNGTISDSSSNIVQEDSSNILYGPNQIGEYPGFNSVPDFFSTSNIEEVVDDINNKLENSLLDSSNSILDNLSSESGNSDNNSIPTPPVPPAPPPVSPTPTPPQSGEMKAVWISYLDLNYLLKGKSNQQFSNNINKAFDNIKSIGLNTVIVHVRPFSDALYQSSFFPWSAYGSGTLGKSPGFDPLTIMVNAAHSRGLKIHAWLNPMRGPTDAEMNKIDSHYNIKKWYSNGTTRGDYVFNISNRWYYNPGVEEVRNLISDGAAEIVKNYNVDGIHIDDYFYPSGMGSHDSAAYQRYKSSGGKLSNNNWRIENNNILVKQMNTAIKSVKSNVIFGVSPSGNNSYNMNTMYADPRVWAGTSGYLDQIIPQIYYGFNNSAKPFEKTVNEWNGYTKASGVKLIVGLATYKIGLNDAHAGSGLNEWVDNKNNGQRNMMQRQILFSRTASKYGGIGLYDYKSLFTPNGDIQINVKDEVDKIKDILK